MLAGSLDRRSSPWHPGVGGSRAAAVGALLVAALAGCGSGGTSAGPPSTSAPSASTPSTSPAALPAPSPTRSVEPTTPAPTPAVVELSGHGVGSVPDGTPGALPALEALLGPADSTDGSLADCGAPGITFATWGKLWVSLDGGALFGWQLNGADRPAVVALPFAVDLGAPYSTVAALPGAGEPQYLENYQVYDVTADGVTWWFDDIQPDSPVVMIGHGILGCG